MRNDHLEDAPTTVPRLRGWFHLVGLVAVLVAGPLLLTERAARTDTAALSVYVASMALLFGTSALYHRVRWTPAVKRAIRRVDHSTIFCAIAGTYTAVATLVLRGWAEILVLSLVWVGAAAGILLRQLWLGAPRRVVALPYVLVGWCALAVLPQLYRGLGTSGFSLVILGGLSYSAGALVYARRAPDPFPRVLGFHEVFHACTVVGATLQFCAIYAAALTRT